jgi:Helicase conserved C-terminal domain
MPAGAADRAGLYQHPDAPGRLGRPRLGAGADGRGPSRSDPAVLVARDAYGEVRPARVVNPPAEPGPPAGVTLDYVGSLANAAVVISRLHRGSKRLVFVDSRARAEQLALALRGHDVTTFVSHGSLGAGQRRAAGQAFAGERDCVIVATSTLELGIDIGDLDRVIQIDAPPTVAAFHQRLGRTGRRPDIARHALVLATSDDALLRSAAVLLHWADGYVEPIIPPAAPLHLATQQLLALSLQEGGIGRKLWAEWLASRSCWAPMPPQPFPPSPTIWWLPGSSLTTAASLGSAKKPRPPWVADISWNYSRSSPRRPSSVSATAESRSASSPTNAYGPPGRTRGRRCRRAAPRRT